MTTGVALVLAGPVGIGAAIALSELVPKKLAATASTVIELLAAVPSIVVGLWALLVLEPMFAKHVEPFLGSVPVVGDLFNGPAYGPSILLASVVLAVMTLPTLVSLSRTALRSVPVEDREAAMALGATRWQVVRKVVLPAARPGIGAAITLAMGRALGEAIAVAMIIGNSPALPALPRGSWCDARICDREPVRRGRARPRYERRDRPRSSPAGPDGGCEHGRAGLTPGGPVRGHGNISGWPARGAAGRSRPRWCLKSAAPPATTRLPR